MFEVVRGGGAVCAELEKDMMEILQELVPVGKT